MKQNSCQTNYFVNNFLTFFLTISDLVFIFVKNNKIMTIEQLNKQILEGKTRNCKKCNQELPVSEFHIQRDKNKNHVRFNSPCKKCAHANRNIEYRKIALRKKKYNLTSEDYDAMLISQNNCCDICNINVKEYGKDFVVDHCHLTNNVRGLLCNNCNTGIGMLQDDASVLVKAIEYLKKHWGK